MRAWLLRGLRVVFIAVSAWLGFSYLAPRGLGWVVWAVLGGLAALYFGRRAHRAIGRRRENARADAWAEALMDPALRPAAIRGLRDEIEALGAKSPVEHARRTLVLAELLEANGEPRAGREALDLVDDAALAESLAAVVRHARAVSSLSAGDAVAAAEALDALPGPCGDAVMDLRIRLLRGLIAVEEGQPERGLEIARELREETDDADLRTELRVLEAVAREAAGQRQAAIKAILALDDEMLDVLRVLGLPRVRAIVTVAMDARR